MSKIFSWSTALERYFFVFPSFSLWGEEQRGEGLVHTFTRVHMARQAWEPCELELSASEAAMLELGMSFDIAAPLLTQIAIGLAKKDLAIALAKEDPSAQEVEAGGWFEWIKEKYPPGGTAKQNMKKGDGSAWDINTLGQVLQKMVTDSRVVRPHLESMSWDADKIQRLQNDVAAMLQYRQFIGHLDPMPSAEEMIFAVGCTERALHGMACTLDQVAL